jgi:CheY-like chemotaxis protein
VLGFAAFVRKGLADDDPMVGDVDQIERAGGRAAGIAQQLLACGRRQPRHPANIDLGRIAQEFTPMLRQAIGPERELVLHTPEQSVSVTADRAQLEQVLLNLALNARDAMSDGGQLRVTVARREIRPDVPVRTPSGVVPAGSYATLEVQDTGEGIDPSLASSIFEPFFTTKGPGQGTGLGLAVVYGIVRQNGGYVSVESAPGEGATFRIYLPDVGTAATTPAAPARPEPMRGNEVLLLVDDDQLILNVAGRVLGDAGYQVLRAGSGAEALALLADSGSSRSPPSLVITDVLMPGIGGRELGERLAQLYPGLPVLYISGHANDAVFGAAVAGRRAEFLGKPFTPDDLLRRVRELLDAKAKPTGGRAPATK